MDVVDKTEINTEYRLIATVKHDVTADLDEMPA